jgi:hypothetical protein
MQCLHLTCSREHLYALVDALKEQFAGCEAVSLIDYGISSKLIQAYIVMGWRDGVDERFIDQSLADNSTILDLSTFTIPCSTDDLFSPLQYV